MRKAPMKVLMRGVPYTLRFTRLRKNYGDVDPPYNSHREMRIDSTQRGKRKLWALIHEALHPCIWDLDHDAINETATSLTDMLWKLQYRERK